MLLDIIMRDVIVSCYYCVVWGWGGHGDLAGFKVGDRGGECGALLSSQTVTHLPGTKLLYCQIKYHYQS